MLFNSFQFIFLFLPISVSVYYLFGAFGWPTLSLAWMVLVSLAFYGWDQPSRLPLLIYSMIFNYWRIRARIFSSTNTSSYLYSRQIRFRCILLTDREPTPRTSLFVGIAKVMAAERLAFAQPYKLSTHASVKVKN